MGCPTVKKAFEDSLNKSSLNNADKILIYDNGTVYNVTYGNFITQLGFSGSLTGQNGGNASPVLNGSAPNYKIRGIVGGAGINASINPNDSITIDVQFANAGNKQSGEPLLPSTSANTVEVRRLKAGRGIDLSTESDSIVINNSQVAASNKTVIVSELSDFPDAVGGVITLADDTLYLMVNDVSTANRFIVGSSTVITSNDAIVSTLAYTGTGKMFTFSNGPAGINELAVSCPNGQLFDANAVTSGYLLSRFLRVKDVKDLGVINHPKTEILNWVIELHKGAGFSYGSITGAKLAVKNTVVLQSTGSGSTFFDLNGATFDSFDVESIALLDTLAGQTFLKGLADGDNLESDTIGYVQKVNIQGSMAMLDTIQNGDVGWDFQDNNKTADTEPHGMVTLDSPTTTVINTANTPVVVTGTFTEQNAQVYETNANGRITYKGVRDIYASIDASISLEPASGTNKTLTAYIAINGAVVSETGLSQSIDSGAPSTAKLTWSDTLSNNDFIEVYVSNDTGTTDITVNQLIFRAH